MTAWRSTLERADRQREVTAALRESGDAHVARRLERCVEVRLSRRHGGGWPEVCGSPGCVWCGPALLRRWWRGIAQWIAEGRAPVSLVVLPLDHPPGGLRAGVARVRRSLRDARDRTARRRGRWRGVAVAEMATGDGTAFVLVRHPGIARSEVVAVLHKRWSGAVVGEIAAAEPSWSMSVEDAAELARARRGIEPLRVVVLPQRAADPAMVGVARVDTAALAVEPMPIAF